MRAAGKKEKKELEEREIWEKEPISE